ncbi:MAG TPA: hypothetical protein VI756_28300 [Blastocatellia bacterium]
MHILMMALYAAVTATVLATIETKPEDNRERVIHGLKVFGAFMVIGIVISWVLYPLPW